MEVKSRKKSNIYVYDMKGEFSRSDQVAATIQDRIKEQLEYGGRHFLFNFDKIDYIDSFGIGELVACYISITKMRGKLKIMNIPVKIAKLFKITMLDRIFEIFDNEETAIKSFSGKAKAKST